MGLRQKIVELLGEKPKDAGQPQPQTIARDQYGTPFDSYFAQYSPTKQVLAVYDAMREAIPLIDVAIRKRARLVTGLRLDGMGDKKVQEILDSVYGFKVGWFQRGIDTLIEQVTDSALHKGYSVWEVVPDVSNKAIYRTVVGKPDNFRFKINDMGLAVVEQEITPGSYLPMLRPDLVFTQVFGATDGGLYGRPVFASCPFIARIVVRILAAVDNVIWRFGDPTIVSILKGGDRIEQTQAAASKFGSEITKAMGARRVGNVYDVNVGVPANGDVKVVMLGADSKPMEVAIDYKLALEQVVSASELPPWMFGLSWATTERLSSNQNEAAISVVDGNRRALEPEIERVVDMALIMGGKGGARYKMEWEPLNLSDEGAEATARLNNAQAAASEIQSAIELYNYGLMNEEQLLAFVVRSGLVSESDLYGSTEAKIVRVQQEAARMKSIGAAKIAMQGVE